MPGSILLGYTVGLSEPALYTLILAAFGLLLVAIVTGFARDIEYAPIVGCN